VSGLFRNPNPSGGGSTPTAPHDLGYHPAGRDAAITALQASSGYKVATALGLTAEAYNGALCYLRIDLTEAAPGIAAVLEGTDPWSHGVAGLTAGSDGAVALSLGTTWAPGTSSVWALADPVLGVEADGDYLAIGFESQAEGGRIAAGGMSRVSGTWRPSTVRGIPNSSLLPSGDSSTFTPSAGMVIGRGSFHTGAAGADRAATHEGVDAAAGPSAQWGITSGSANRLGGASDARIVVASRGGAGHTLKAIIAAAAWRIAP